jgi:hypothetical protein
MALQGTLILNGADYVPFNLYGVGVFRQGAYMNNAACGAIPNEGPIPPGKYWIVDRGSGGRLSRLIAKSQDFYNRMYEGAEFDHDEWFALFKDDWTIDDHSWIDGVKRGLFRLHPGRVSNGCITLVHNSDYALIRNALMQTSLIQVPCMKSLMARGWIEVIASGNNNTCP